MMTMVEDGIPASALHRVVTRCAGFVLPALAALQFLTVAPAIVRRPFSAGELGRAVAFFPAVGVLIGAVLFGLDWLAAPCFSPGVSSVLILAAWVLITGALHIDGFLDTCDGLWGGRTVADRLRIMRDERVGSYAVTGGILLLLVKYSALAATLERSAALLLAPVLGRWVMALVIVAFPYARPEGLGRDIKDHASWSTAGLASATALAAVWFVGDLHAWTALATAFVGLVACAWLVLRRLPGFTGDTYGFVCEIVECLVLLTFAAEVPA